MATSHFPSRSAFFQEVTQGTPPANAAAWVSSGSAIRHIASSLNVSSLVQSMIEDERSQVNITDDEAMIRGIIGGGDVEVPLDLYLHATGQTIADGSAIVTDDLADLIGHAWGGSTLGTSDALVAAGAHTTTAVELTDTIPVGNWVGLDDADGITHLRRVESIAAGGVGQIHTLHRALPFTPQDADLARACITSFLDEDVLEDSAAGPYELSWLWERGRGSQRETWQAAGCKTSVTGIKLARNELAVLSTVTRVGTFLTPEASPVPTWTADPTGSAGSSIGPRTRVWLQDRDTTTDATVQVATFELDPGILSVPIQVQTEDALLPGLYGYTLARNPCTLSLSVVPHTNTPITDFQNRTEKSIQYERLGAVGSSWAIYLPRCTYSGTPVASDVSSVLGQTLTYRAHYDDDETTAIARSRVQLIRC